MSGTEKPGYFANILILLMGAGAWSEALREIKIVVLSPAGDPTDILARLIAKQIERMQGVTIVIENHVGDANQIGTEYVARAYPDGSTLLMTASSFAISAHFEKLSYDPLTSFEPICHLVNSPQLVAVLGTSPYRTLGELIEAVHAKPNTLTLAAVGPGTAAHIGFEMLKRAANLDMAFVAYSGSTLAINALLDSHVTAVIAGYASMAPQLATGQLRALAIGTRIKELPDVLSIAESGYRDIEINDWFGVVAPAKTPKEIVSQLAGWFTAALQDAEVRSKLDALQLYPIGQCGVNFATYIRGQYLNYGRIIREANIKAERTALRELRH